MFKQLETVLADFLNQPSQHFCVAYSGGVDSHVLLHAMAQVLTSFPQHRLSAIHVNHGINVNATVWQDHCQNVCETLDIELTCATLALEKQAQISLEAVARDARYRAIAQHVDDKALVLLGQHRDDQAETMLLQLFRGAGPKGLSAMPFSSVNKFNTTQHLIRPLLHVSQQDVVNFANEHGLMWQDDDSNLNTDFDRNFLRLEILPKLVEKWPSLSQNISRSAALCAEQQTLLDEVTAQKLAEVIGESECLDSAKLLALSVSWMKQVVRLWLSNQGYPMPSQAILEKLIPEVLHAKDDAKPKLQWQGYAFRRYQGFLYVVSEEALPRNTVINIDNGNEHIVTVLEHMKVVVSNSPNQAAIACDGKVEIQFDGFSKRFTPKNVSHSKPLKQWFKEWGVAPWLRSLTPQLVVNDELIGVWVSNQWILSQHYMPSKTPAGYVYIEK